MFTLYKASAGSGKTSRLVVEYLALCLPQPEKFKHVLAITFTNNATAEMKSRIVKTLSQLAFEPQITPNSSIYHTYNQIVEKIAKQLPENEQHLFIQHQSKILLEKILYEYDRFSISTIDTFFQRILRSFALEFGLHTQFNLEITLDEFFRETISVLLNRLSKENTRLTRLVLDLVENNMLEKGRWKMEHEILKLLNFSMKEDAFEPLKKLKESENNNFEQAKKQITKEIFRVRTQLKQFSTPKEKKSEECKLLKEQLQELLFFNQNLFQLTLLFDLKMIMDEIKAQENRFFLSETNALIHEKLRDEEVPFIYEKMGNQYSYFFIDEFQDTSQLQWKNLLPLLREALAGTNRFREQGKVYIFGDVKQAIYRFRNGDADILQQLSSIEGYRDAVLPYAKHDIDYQVAFLDTNYRSARKIVEFNNDFFNYLTGEGGMFADAKPFYEEVVQKIKPKAEEGVVALVLQKEEDERDFWEFIHEPLLEIVVDALQRGYSYRDIAVLVAGNDKASEIGASLLAHHFPIISAESLQLSASKEINTVIATLQYVVSKEDKLAKLAIVHYLTQRYNLLFEDYFSCVQNEEFFQQFLTNINIKIDRNRFNSLPLLTLLYEICNLYSFSAANPFLIELLEVAEEFSARRNGTLPLFLKWWEEEGAMVALSTPQGTDAITVSTIHKAKGLEYPVVILPFSSFGNSLTQSDIFIQDHVTGLEYDWVHLTQKSTPERLFHLYERESMKTKMDNLNKLYVAHTRAGKELHIIGTKNGIYSKYLEICGEQYVESRKFSLTPSIPQSLTPSATQGAFGNQGSMNDLQSLIPSSPQQRGIFIHNSLSSLSVFPQNSEEVKSILRNVEETYREDLANVFHKILNDESLQPYFAPDVKVLNETSILFPNGNLLRPDRIVFIPLNSSIPHPLTPSIPKGRVVVIDYKTGEPNASHKEQIEQYCEAIREMGYENVEGRVLYV